jgi:hypothetical protein
MLSASPKAKQTGLPSAADELFKELPAFLPALTEGETLFSWSARYHRLSGNALAARSSLQLFGSARAGLRHDLPYNLDRFAEITGGLVGHPAALAAERTLFGFYAPFLGVETRRKALGVMQGASAARLKSLLGLLSSRVGAAHPLKACPDCIREDHRKHCVTRWVLEHQWPSVWICRKHRRLLMHLRSSAQPREFRRWLLPEDVCEADWGSPVSHNRLCAARLLSIADASAGFVAHPEHSYDVKLARYTYLVGAKSRGWLAPDGSVRLQELRRAFLEHYAAIENVPVFSLVQAVQSEHGGLLGMLMRQYPGRRHPVKHALVVAFLFGSFDDFLATYRDAQEYAAQVGADNLHRLLCGAERAKLRRLVEAEHKSVSAAARDLGLNVTVAIQWASRSGVQYQKRPKVLTGESESHLRLLIQAGKEYAEISREMGIRKSFIRSYLANDTVLRQFWHQRRREKLRESHRKALLGLLEAHRGVPLKKIRLIPGNGFSWLARNDRDWLVQNLPMLRSTQGGLGNPAAA